MKITASEKEAMIRIVQKNHKVGRKRAKEIIEEMNGGLLSEIAKENRRIKMEKKLSRSKDFSSHFRELKSAKKNILDLSR